MDMRETDSSAQVTHLWLFVWCNDYSMQITRFYVIVSTFMIFVAIIIMENLCGTI